MNIEGVRKFKLKIDLPYLPKGTVYAFVDDIGQIYRCNDDRTLWEYPLRSGLAGYLWLLRTDGKKYFKEL